MNSAYFTSFCLHGNHSSHQSHTDEASLTPVNYPQCLQPPNPLKAVMTLAGGSDHYHYCFVSEQAEAGAMTQAEGRVQASCGFWAPNSTSLLSLPHVVFCLHGLIASKHVLDGDLFCYTVSQWIPLRAESICSDLY